MRCLLCGFWTVYVYLYPLLRLALAITHKKKRLYATSNVQGHHICYDISLTHKQKHNDAPYTDTSVSCEVRGVSCEARLCDQASRRSRRGPRCAVAACACSLHLARGCAGAECCLLCGLWWWRRPGPWPRVQVCYIPYLRTVTDGDTHAPNAHARRRRAGRDPSPRGGGAPRGRASLAIRNPQPAAGCSTPGPAAWRACASPVP